MLEFYLQAHGAGGTGETSGSLVTFLTKEPLLASGPGLSISSLQGKAVQVSSGLIKGLISPRHMWDHTNPIPVPGRNHSSASQEVVFGK